MLSGIEYRIASWIEAICSTGYPLFDLWGMIYDVWRVVGDHAIDVLVIQESLEQLAGLHVLAQSSLELVVVVDV